MRRLLIVVLASSALSGCASYSFDMFKPSPPPPVTVQLESVPPGADAVTSIGPGCRTPCSVSVPPTPNFTVTYSLAKYQPATVPVAMTINPGDWSTPASTTVDPNPAIAELQPMAPPKRVVKRAKRPAKPKPAAAPAATAPAAAPAAPAGGTAFPAPTR